MRIAFCKFPLASDPKTDVSINPLQVSYFTSHDGKTTTIHFDAEHSVVVGAPHKAVEDGLNIDVR
ncbi:MAG: hypothetical protein ABIS45_03045 [Burkholderiales bacterium]